VGPLAAPKEAEEVMQIGSLRVQPVLDARSSTAPELVYQAAARYFPPIDGARGLAAEDWKPYARFHEQGKLDLSYGGFLVSDGGGRRILVDLGQGPAPWTPDPAFATAVNGKFLESLAALDTLPEDITDVVLTHLHADHVGWASVDGVPAFPNATYRCHADDLAHFLPNEPMIAAVLNPVLSRIETWDSDTTLFPGFDIRPAPGHTPGSSLIVLSDGAQRLLFVGDVMHCPAELLDDEWAGLADMDPVLAGRVRVALAKELEQEAAVVAPAHFPGLSFGRLLSGDGGGRDFTYLSA
jgi:glyoxylase-like metal-dependent hydrolase (beta-lactamase superfamily II)